MERACFSPLVFAATGGMGPTATSVFWKLASMLAEKWNVNYDYDYDVIWAEAEKPVHPFNYIRIHT